MYMKKIAKLVTILSFLIAVFGMAFSAQFSFAEIAADTYCQLTVQTMEQEVSNLNQFIALANQYKDDPEALAQQEEIKRVEFDQTKDFLFSSFGITDEEYVTYMGQNGRTVSAFLNENTDIKQEIDDLSAQIGSLLEEYESLKGTGSPAPPLP